MSGNQACAEFRGHATPTCTELSPLSFVIYAKNHGVFERAENGESYWEKWLLPDEEHKSLEKKSYFIMKDGSKEPINYGWHSTTHANEDNMNSDVILYSNQFLDGTEVIPTTPKLMDVEEFEAVVINGVRFEFGEVNICKPRNKTRAEGLSLPPDSYYRRLF